MVLAAGAFGATKSSLGLLTTFWLVTGFYVYLSTYLFLVGGILLTVKLMAVWPQGGTAGAAPP